MRARWIFCVEENKIRDGFKPRGLQRNEVGQAIKYAGR